MTEVKVLREALQRTHEGSNRELQLSEKSSKALTSHMKILQVRGGGGGGGVGVDHDDDDYDDDDYDDDDYDDDL